MDRSTAEDRILLERLERAQAEPFEGWDFSRLQGRMVTAALPWDYQAIVRESVPRATAMLDMDTGGGEMLLSFRPHPPHTAATEAYPPNIEVARTRLAPLGVEVYAIAGNEVLPFSSNSYDLIINRHGAYRPGEVARVLRAGGRFITQQVGSRNLETLNRRLGADPDLPEWTLDGARHELEDAGLMTVRAEEDFPITRFVDVEAIVYFLKAVPWQVPGFSIATHFEQLKALDREIRAQGELQVYDHRFLLVSAKASSSQNIGG